MNKHSLVSVRCPNVIMKSAIENHMWKIDKTVFRAVLNKKEDMRLHMSKGKNIQNIEQVLSR